MNAGRRISGTAGETRWRTVPAGQLRFSVGGECRALATNTSRMPLRRSAIAELSTSRAMVRVGAIPSVLGDPDAEDAVLAGDARDPCGQAPRDARPAALAPPGGGVVGGADRAGFVLDERQSTGRPPQDRLTFTRRQEKPPARHKSPDMPMTVRRQVERFVMNTNSRPGRSGASRTSSTR